MPYKVFEKKIVRNSSPTLSIGKFGRIGLNQSSARYFRDTAVELVLLLWDEDARRLALRPTSKKDSKAYTLRFDKEGLGSGAGFFAKSFFHHIGYDYSETRVMPAEWNENQQILEVQLPDEGFSTSTNKEATVFALREPKQAGAKRGT